MRPSNSSISSSERAIPVGAPLAALLAVALIACFEVLVAVHRERLMGALELIALRKRAMMTDRTTREDVVVFGDSRMFSVSPRLVGESLAARRAANYSWPFAGIEMYDYMLNG